MSAADDRPLAARPRAHDAASASRSTTDGRDVDVRRARRRRSRRARRARSRARRPRLDADRQHGRARRRLLRVREGGRDPAPDLVAARAAPRSPTSSTTPSRRSSSSRTSTRELAEARSRSPRVAPAPSLTRRGSRAERPARRRRPAAPDLHVRHDREAEGRAAHARELLLDEPLASTSRPASSGDDVVLQVLPQFHCGGWNVQPLLAWWKGARVVLERGFDADRALELIERKRVTTMMGVPANYLFMAQEPRFADADLSSLRRAVVGGAPMPRGAARDVGGARRRDRPGLRADRGGAERALPPARGRRAQGRLRGQAVPVRRVRRSPTRASCSCAARTSSPATGATPRRRPRRSPTAGCSPATSPSATTRATTGSAAGSRTCTSRAARTSTRPRSRRCCTSIRGVAEAAVVGVPDERWGEVGAAFVVLEPGAALDRGRDHRASAASASHASRCRSRSASSTSCRATRAWARSRRTSSRGRGAGMTETSSRAASTAARSRAAALDTRRRCSTRPSRSSATSATTRRRS